MELDEEYPVHPAAAIYPMMSNDELQDLAISIKEHGQYHPIELARWLVDQEVAVTGIIDGRNRQRACEIAGVKPEYKTLDFKYKDDEIRLYIFQSNRFRRSLNAGQLAMSYAMMFPDREIGGRGKKRNPSDKQTGNKNPSASEGFSTTRLSQARTILDHSREYAEAIMRGDMLFDAVLKKVNSEQTAAAKLVREETQKANQLREQAPDLARDVELGNLTHEDAQKELRERIAAENEQIAKENRKRAEIFHSLWTFTHSIRVFVTSEEMPNIPQWLEDTECLKEFQKQFPRGVVEFLERIDEEEINDAADIIIKLIRTLRTQGKPAIRIVE